MNEHGWSEQLGNIERHVSRGPPAARCDPRGDRQVAREVFQRAAAMTGAIANPTCGSLVD